MISRMKTNYVPPPGATLYVRTNSVFSRFTAWATRGKSEHHTLATHQGKFITSFLLFHALPPKARYQFWSEYKDWLIGEGAQWAVVERATEPVTEDIRELENISYEMEGWRYSHLELPLQLADGMLSKLCGNPRSGMDAVVFRKMGKLWKKGVICSKTANRIDIKMGWKPKDLAYGSPDDSWDYETHHPDWRIGYVSPGWYR